MLAFSDRSSLRWVWAVMAALIAGAGLLCADHFVLAYDSHHTSRALQGDGLADSNDEPKSLRLSPRGMIIVEPSMGKVMMSYFFGVVNPQSQPVFARVAIMYPKRMLSLQPVVGLSEVDIVFDDQHAQLVVAKEFSPGTHVHAVRFVVDGGSRSLEVLWELPQMISSLSVMRSAQYDFHIESSQWHQGIPQDLEQSEFVGITRKEVPSGELSIVLKGMPEDRRRYLALGVVFAVIMMIVTVMGIRKEVIS